MRDEFDTDVRDEGFPSHDEIAGGGNGQSFGVEVGREGQSFGEEVGGEGDDTEAVQLGIYRTLTKARDNRRPAPLMRAMPTDVPPERRPTDQSLIGICGGPGEDLFPLTTSLLKQFGESGEPRIVRIDTVKSYRRFRVQDSPEMSELKERVSAVQKKLEAHLHDPDAHDPTPPDFQEELTELDQLGAAVDQIEQAKQIPLRMPRHFDGLIGAWHAGDLIGTSLVLPGADGNPRICTSMEPLSRGVLEAAKAATEACVPAAQIIGFLPAIGAALSAATAIKETASGVESILQRPEAKGTTPFLLRLEPKTSPAIFTLATLAKMCASGHEQACDEWQRLAAAGPAEIKQAMAEVQQALRTPASTVVGGSNEEGWLSRMWDRVMEFFGLAERESAKTKPPSTAAAQKALQAKSTVVPANGGPGSQANAHGAEGSAKPDAAPATPSHVGWY